MNRKEFLKVGSIFLDDTINELRRVRAGNPLFDKEIGEYKKLLEEDDAVDDSYKQFLLCLVNVDENFGPEKELCNKDDVNERDAVCDSEEENDPRYEHFLKHLKEHGKFYALEYEKDGVRVVHKYGEDSDSDEVHDPRPTRKRKRATKQKIVPSNQRPLTRSKEKTKVDRVENVIGSPDVVLESHKECGPELGKKVKKTRKQKAVSSNQRRLSQSQVKTKVDRVEDVIGSSDMVLESHKECGGPQLGKKVNKTRKRKVGPSNQMPDVENRPSDALKMTMRLTQSRAKLANEVEAENVKGSPDVVLVSHRRKLNRVTKPKTGPSNQMSDVENQRKHDRRSNSVIKTNRLTKRKSTKEADKVENTKGLRNDMVQDLQYHHLNQNVKLEKDQCGYLHNDKEFEPEHRRRVNVTWEQKAGPSNQMPDLKKKCKHDQSSCSKCRTKSKVTFEVDRVYNNKECDSEPRRQLNLAMTQKDGCSNQMPDVEKKQKHDQLSCSLKKTKGLTKGKVKLEVDKVHSGKGAPNGMVLNLNNKCDLQPRKKLKRATKQDIGPPNQMPGVETKRKGDQQYNSLKKKKCPTQKILTDEVTIENMNDSPNDMVPDPEYLHLHLHLHQNVELDHDHYGSMHEVNTGVNDKNHGSNDVKKNAKDAVCFDRKIDEVNDVKKEREDDSDSDVEILDSEAIIEKGISSTFVPSKRVHYSMQEHLGRSSKSTEFRKQAMNVLSKPFDKEEYVRHQEAAKCYLDHHPDLRRRLAKYRYKQGKRMTIYRGFFFWLQNLTQEGSFRPWMDRECLAVEPESP